MHHQQEFSGVVLISGASYYVKKSIFIGAEIVYQRQFVRSITPM
jgi:hypothetical protein